MYFDHETVFITHPTIHHGKIIAMVADYSGSGCMSSLHGCCISQRYHAVMYNSHMLDRVQCRLICLHGDNTLSDASIYIGDKYHLVQSPSSIWQS